MKKFDRWNDSHFNVDKGELWFGGYTARNLNGLNRNFKRILPNSEIFPKTGSAAQYNTSYTMYFNNLGVLSPYTGTHPLYIGLYAVSFAVLGSSFYTTVTENVPYNGEYDITPVTTFDEFLQPTANSTGYISPKYICFSPELCPLSSTRPTVFSLKNIISYFGVFRLPLRHQQHIFNTTLDNSYDPFRDNRTNIYPLTTASWINPLSLITYNNIRVDPLNTQAFIASTNNINALSPTPQFYIGNSGSGLSNIVQWRLNSNSNVFCLDGLYKVFVVRQIPTATLQPLNYTMYQFVLYDSLDNTIVGEVVT